MEGDLDELVALHEYARRLAVVHLLQRGRRRCVVRLARLAFARVQDLRDKKHFVNRTLEGHSPANRLAWKIRGMSLASALMTSPWVTERT